MGSIDKACISGFLCRLCSEMHRIVIHIYGDQGKRLCLVEKINGYLPITISPSDPLPKTICETCLRRVEQHYDLLMRLSRIKEDRLMQRVNKPHRTLPEISSPELSEDDDLYNSDDDNRTNTQLSIEPNSMAANFTVPRPDTQILPSTSGSSSTTPPIHLSSATSSQHTLDHND